MFNKLLGRFSADIGIDLGTNNTLVYVKDKGIVISEPSVVAINTRTNQILSIGEDAKKAAGAREVFLIEQPVAAAIGARVPIQEPSGFMIVELGGGTTEVAVISLGGVVTSNSLTIAGNE